MATRLPAGMVWLYAALIVVLAGIPPAAAKPPSATIWNSSPDPAAIYGGCRGVPAFEAKLLQLEVAGQPLTDILAISVITCRTYGSGSLHTAPCPAGSPFQSCVSDGNDGVGDAVRLGILRRGPVADPHADYTGCPAGSTVREKIGLLKQTTMDPRAINGIVTIACGPATGAPGVAVVACPSYPDLYAYCLATQNDGSGNAVTLGVVAANGPGDPYGLYGGCVQQGQKYSGYARKIDLVAAAGRDPAQVQRIEILICKINQGEPPVPTATDCSQSDLNATLGALRSRYDYCIWGTDRFGNQILAGVTTLR